MMEITLKSMMIRSLVTETEVRNESSLTTMENGRSCNDDKGWLTCIESDDERGQEKKHRFEH